MSRTTWIRIAIAIAVALIVLVAFRLHLAAGPAMAQTPHGDPLSGLHYAEALCTECHSVVPETDGTGQFAPDFTAIAKRRSTTTRSVRNSIRFSHQLMPTFDFSRQEASDIVAYILSLKRE